MLYGHSQNDSIKNALPLIRRLKPDTWVALDPPGSIAFDNGAIADLAGWFRDHGVRLIVRRHWRYDFGDGAVRDDMDRSLSPLAAAREFVDSCKAQAWWPAAWAVMTPPAMAVDTSPPDLLEWSIGFQGWVYALLAAAGRETIVCNVPNQNWGYYVPAPAGSGLPDPDKYGCQEYFYTDGGPSGLLEYRNWFPQRVLSRNPSAGLYVLECGATGLIADPPIHPDATAPHGADIGFRGGHGVAALDRPYFLGRIFGYVAESRKDRYVRGRYYFEVGGNRDWWTHEALGGGGFEEELASQEPTGTVEEEQMAEKIYDVDGPPQFVLGFDTYAQAHPEVGAAVTNQITLHQPDGRDVITLQEAAHAVLGIFPGGQPFHLPKG